VNRVWGRGIRFGALYSASGSIAGTRTVRANSRANAVLPQPRTDNDDVRERAPLLGDRGRRLFRLLRFLRFLALFVTIAHGCLLCLEVVLATRTPTARV
jgi:hypothetical protein